MLNGRALEKLETTQSDSFSLDLKKWHGIMKAYLGGGAASAPKTLAHGWHAPIDESSARSVARLLRVAPRLGLHECRRVRRTTYCHGFGRFDAFDGTCV